MGNELVVMNRTTEKLLFPFWGILFYYKENIKIALKRIK